MSSDWFDISVTHNLALAVAGPLDEPPLSKSRIARSGDNNTDWATAFAVGSFN
ncbi:MAG: hypothetical protein VYC76_06765 [Pseudomonadota bacterium]|nr:hypothetical protein [Pseudomonadota bacterium]